MHPTLRQRAEAWAVRLLFILLPAVIVGGIIHWALSEVGVTLMAGGAMVIFGLHMTAPRSERGESMYPSEFDHEDDSQ